MIIYFFPGEFLGALCQVLGASVYEKCSSELMKSVEENLERHIPGDENSEGQHYSDEAVPVDVSNRGRIDEGRPRPTLCATFCSAPVSLSKLKTRQFLVMTQILHLKQNLRICERKKSNMKK